MLKDFIKTRNGRIIMWAAIVLAVVLFVWLTMPKIGTKTGPSANANSSLQPADNVPAEMGANANAPKIAAPAKNNVNTKAVGFAEKKTPHLVSSTIANNATLNQVPATLTLTFDAPITKNLESFITVKRDQIYSATQGNSYIGGDGKTMSVNLNPQVKDGDYYVYYVACFADTGCKDGRFGYHLKLPQ